MKLDRPRMAPRASARQRRHNVHACAQGVLSCCYLHLCDFVPLNSDTPKPMKLDRPRVALHASARQCGASSPVNNWAAGLRQQAAKQRHHGGEDEGFPRLAPPPDAWCAPHGKRLLWQDSTHSQRLSAACYYSRCWQQRKTLNPRCRVPYRRCPAPRLRAPRWRRRPR